MTINGTTTSEAAAVLCLVCLYIFLFKLLPKHKNQKTTASRHYAIDFKYLRQNKTCTQWKCALSSPTHFLLTAPLKSTSLPKNYGTKASKQANKVLSKVSQATCCWIRNRVERKIAQVNNNNNKWLQLQAGCKEASPRRKSREQQQESNQQQPGLRGWCGEIDRLQAGGREEDWTIPGATVDQKRNGNL
jgi:hypothetical protein